MSQLNFLDQLKQERRALSVSELTARIKTAIESKFLDVWVEGEISNFVRHGSGHWYFSLKDEAASIRCASFKLQNRFIRFRPADGLHVRARGRVSVYEPRGEYQLVVEQLEPIGLGALQLAFEQLKTRLAAEGLFAAERKRTLPLLPRCVGVVTSPTGAAVRDILRVIRRRNRALNVLIAPARVQGDGAAGEICRAIRLLNARTEIDAIIVGRGGGSIEDLWVFNEESVARAIARSRVPVISAVGHEIDFTISDFVADLRASTPSAAAEIVAAAHIELSNRISRLSEDLVRAMDRRLGNAKQDLGALERSRGFESVRNRLQSTLQQLDYAVSSMERALIKRVRESRTRLAELSKRLSEADIARALAGRRERLMVVKASLESLIRSSLRSSGERVSVSAGKLNSLSPLAVLARGYAIAFDSTGRVIKRASEVASGESLTVKVNDGVLDCIKK
jgi:exodeoxyribonuclease VII large subunit